MTASYPPVAVLDTPEGETALLRAIINARPVGMAKHWAMVSILLYLEQILGEGRVTGEEVWNKLRTLYDLDLLDEDSDLNTPNDALPSEDDPSSSTAGRKRRGRFSANAATAADTSATYDPQSSVKSEFSLLNKRAFQEEFAKRRKSSHSPSPSPFLTSSMSLEPEDEDEQGDEEEEDDEEAEEEVDDDEEDNEDTVMQDGDDDGEQDEQEEEEEEESKPSKGRRSVSRSRQPKKSISKMKPSKAKNGSSSGRGKPKASKGDVDSDDAVSETASTLSALSEDGEAGRARASGKADEDGQDDEEEKSAEDDDVEQEHVDQDDEADETGSGTEPDIGPDDTPFKTPKGIKKRQQQFKGKRRSSAGAEEDEEMEEAGSDNEGSPTTARKQTRGPKSGPKSAGGSSKSKNLQESVGIARVAKGSTTKNQNTTGGENAKRKPERDSRRR